MMKSKIIVPTIVCTKSSFDNRQNLPSMSAQVKWNINQNAIRIGLAFAPAFLKFNVTFLFIIIDVIWLGELLNPPNHLLCYCFPVSYARNPSLWRNKTWSNFNFIKLRCIMSFSSRVTDSSVCFWRSPKHN